MFTKISLYLKIGVGKWPFSAAQNHFKTSAATKKKILKKKVP